MFNTLSDGNLYLPILYLPKLELHCKLHEKLHRVTGPLGQAVGREHGEDDLLQDVCFQLCTE